MHQSIEFEDDTDAVGPELITLEALKLELGIDDDSEDELLQAQITRQSNLIAEHFGQRLGFANAVETFVFDYCEPLRRGVALALSLYPVRAIVSVVAGGSEVSASDYSINKTSGLLRLANGFWSGTIVVTYSGGYDLPDGAPALLSSAVIESIRQARRSADTGGAVSSAVSSVQHGDTRVSYFQDSSSSSSSGGLTPSVIDLLSQFRARQQTF